MKFMFKDLFKDLNIDTLYRHGVIHGYVTLESKS